MQPRMIKKKLERQIGSYREYTCDSTVPNVREWCEEKLI